MEVDYKVYDGYCTGSARIYPHDLLAGKHIIYLGGDFDRMDYVLKNDSQYITDKRIIKKYNSMRKFTEDYIEGIITHEWLHLLIFDITKSLPACRRFDIIDREDQISDFGFWKNQSLTSKVIK